MKTLFFDCFAGASGDMILGALVALGVDREALIGQLKLLNLEGWQIEFSTVDRSGISANFARVAIPHEHKHRHLHHIEKIIADSGLTESVKRRAIQIFTRLAEAEAWVHGISIEKVHFHEVGAMDAILDVTGACIGFEMLGIEHFVCSKLNVGSGFVRMAHGNFPVPPPAVVELLKETRAPVYSTEITGELLTPTGAAIITTVCEEYGAPPDLQIEKTGYGAGSREYKDFPNVLRLLLGETSKERRTKNDEQILVLLETNVDDLSPEISGFVLERALASGALDVWFSPILMKKSRPAVQISVLCRLEDKEKFLRLLFRETSTLGVRETEVKRHALPRETVRVETNFGAIDVKFARSDGNILKAAPEYEQCCAAALKFDVPLREVERAALKAFEEILEKI
ncbi:MAG: nickel pincer cofactor biosynthesis protein LarC [Acidobacteriota bacterium]|nr:nickel pincer cofactor biosynthesis protein LarC [Acidobacteriota bacterium]